eukprot:31444-Pelagococcus_subviridis.AAC.2
MKHTTTDRNDSNRVIVRNGRNARNARNARIPPDASPSSGSPGVRRPLYPTSTSAKSNLFHGSRKYSLTPTCAHRSMTSTNVERFIPLRVRRLRGLVQRERDDVDEDDDDDAELEVLALDDRLRDAVSGVRDLVVRRRDGFLRAPRRGAAPARAPFEHAARAARRTKAATPGRVRRSAGGPAAGSAAGSAAVSAAAAAAAVEPPAAGPHAARAGSLKPASEPPVSVNPAVARGYRPAASDPRLHSRFHAFDVRHLRLFEFSGAHRGGDGVAEVDDARRPPSAAAAAAASYRGGGDGRSMRWMFIGQIGRTLKAETGETGERRTGESRGAGREKKNSPWPAAAAAAAPPPGLLLLPPPSTERRSPVAAPLPPLLPHPNPLWCREPCATPPLPTLLSPGAWWTPPPPALRAGGSIGPVIPRVYAVLIASTSSLDSSAGWTEGGISGTTRARGRAAAPVGRSIDRTIDRSNERSIDRSSRTSPPARNGIVAPVEIAARLVLRSRRRGVLQPAAYRVAVRFPTRAVARRGDARHPRDAVARRRRDVVDSNAHSVWIGFFFARRAPARRDRCAVRVRAAAPRALPRTSDPPPRALRSVRRARARPRVAPRAREGPRVVASPFDARPLRSRGLTGWSTNRRDR